jgi:regulator of sigma E protease
MAGLQTGDILQSIDGRPIRDYSDLQEIIASNPGKTLSVQILRNGSIQHLTVTPRLDSNTGAGVIGVYPWIDPLVSSVKEQSPAAIADLRPGDKIISANGKPIRNTIDLMNSFKAANGPIELTIERNGQNISTTIIAKSLEETGISFVSITRTDKASSLPDAIAKGAKETLSTFTLTIKSIGLLFRGVNVFKAVSGPARITYLIGTAASEQIKVEGLAGLVPVLSFLAFLSVGLAIMNLLPLPVLDGGLILVFFIELARRRPLSAKTLYRYQFIGAAFVLVLFVIATMSDIFFFTGR